jgi:putative sterol carrier protein
VSAQPLDVDIESLTPEQFARLVHDHDNAVVRATFRDIGTGRALDRIFEIMQGRYVGGESVTATVQWHITDDDHQHDYVVELRAGGCTTRAGAEAAPRATLKTDLARFARLAAGQANGVKLLMTRKLRASGDVNFARKLQAMFDIPQV